MVSESEEEVSERDEDDENRPREVGRSATTWAERKGKKESTGESEERVRKKAEEHCTEKEKTERKWQEITGAGFSERLILRLILSVRSWLGRWMASVGLRLRLIIWLSSGMSASISSMLVVLPLREIRAGDMIMAATPISTLSLRGRA